MAGSSDKSIALDTENVRDIGATYTVGYSNATDRQKLRFQSSALGSDQPNEDLAAELRSYVPANYFYFAVAEHFRGCGVLDCRPFRYRGFARDRLAAETSA